MVTVAGCDKQSKSFLALGDSYTIGESVPESARWPVQLAGMLRKDKVDVGDPIIIAKTGWTTDELSAAIDAAKIDGKEFDLVTLLIGVNNQYRNRSSDEYRTQFAALLTRAIKFARGDARHVIVMSIPDWGVTPFAEGRDRAQIGREIDLFNKIAREETERAGSRYVDVTPLSREFKSLVAEDGLHPSGEMYRRWAEAALADARAALK
ncbi:MAG: SGNH/GDSL hydrolase family protein [Anaerolineae bacterium]|nr:SGNH/GDSL hydrolase family protein [Phycisphaerae bacterium]